MGETLVHVAIIFFVGALVFSNVLDNSFIGDDEIQIVENPLIHSLSWENIAILFKGSTFSSFGAPKSHHGVYYKPFMSLSYMLLWAIDGANPFYYHFFQVLLYIINASLLYFILCYFFNKSESLLLALVFLVNPMTSEVARYIADYQDVLYFFFGSLSFLWLTYYSSRVRSSIFYPVLCFLLLSSLLSKESGILFFAIIFYYTILYQPKKTIPVVFSLVVLLSLYFYLRFEIAGIGILGPGIFTPIGNASFLQRLVCIPSIWYYYLINFIFGQNLAINQNWVVGSLSLEKFWLPVLVVITFAWFFKKWLKHSVHRGMYFFMGWFLSGLLFHSQLFPLDVTVANRWFYFPAVGLIALFFIGIKDAPKPPRRRIINATFFLVFVCYSGARTVVRNQDWQRD